MGWVVTGNALNLAGNRKKTNFKINASGNVSTIDPTTKVSIHAATVCTKATPWVGESFEISVRNHKRVAVDVRIVEHLYRWNDWEITSKSQAYKKIDARTIEFPVRINPDAEAKVNYTVHYTW